MSFYRIIRPCQVVIFDSKRVNIKQADNFKYANINDITMSFTTTQKSHSDIFTKKTENGCISGLEESLKWGKQQSLLSGHWSFQEMEF